MNKSFAAIKVRNKHLGQLMADSAGQANEMAQSLLYFEGLLRELTASAKTRLLLVSNAPAVSVYHHTDYLDPATAPADLALSPRYDIRVVNATSSGQVGSRCSREASGSKRASLYLFR